MRTTFQCKSSIFKSGRFPRHALFVPFLLQTHQLTISFLSVSNDPTLSFMIQVPILLWAEDCLCDLAPVSVHKGLQRALPQVRPSNSVQQRASENPWERICLPPLLVNCLFAIFSLWPLICCRRSMSTLLRPKTGAMRPWWGLERGVWTSLLMLPSLQPPRWDDLAFN